MVFCAALDLETENPTPTLNATSSTPSTKIAFNRGLMFLGSWYLGSKKGYMGGRVLVNLKLLESLETSCEAGSKSPAR